MTKFAADTYLPVRSKGITTVADEIANIKDWAAQNNMRIHTTKTMELVICRTRFRLPPTTPCPIVEGAERVNSLRVLIVQLDSRLSMGDHITKILTPVPHSHMHSESCDLTASSPMSSTSLLEPPLLLPFFMPRQHGTDSQTKVITSVLTTSSLRCDEADIYLRTFLCLAMLIDEVDRKLFRSISHNPTHILCHYFIDKHKSGHSLSTWAHKFVLPIKDDKNFVARPTYATLKIHRETKSSRPYLN